MHEAIDILAPRGTPVIAADSGRLIRIGFNALGANVMASLKRGDPVIVYGRLRAALDGVAQADRIVALSDGRIAS